MYLQTLWFCTRCGDLDNALEHDLYYREDKIRDHIRQDHPDWIQQGLGNCKVPKIPSVPFPRRCGFCDRNRFCARDWAHRCSHIAMHYKKGATINQWRVWPEDEPEEEDDLVDGEPDSPKPDDDNNHQNGGNGDDGDQDQGPSSPPPSNKGPDGSAGEAPGGWSPTIGEFLHPWNYEGQSWQGLLVVSPLPGHQGLIKSQKLPQWTLPILSKERINLKGGTASVHKIVVPRSHLPWLFKKDDVIESGGVCSSHQNCWSQMLTNV